MSKTPKPRGVICIWCGKIIIPVLENISMPRVYEIMKRHDLTCTESPLVQENARLKQRIAELEGK